MDSAGNQGKCHRIGCEEGTPLEFCPADWGRLPHKVRELIATSKAKARNHGHMQLGLDWSQAMEWAIGFLYREDCLAAIAQAKPFKLQKGGALYERLLGFFRGEEKLEAMRVVIVPDAPFEPVEHEGVLYVQTLEGLRQLVLAAKNGGAR